MTRSLATYDAETLEAGLAELAIWNGSAKNASRTLAERGIHIPATTLQSWKRMHAERLVDVESQVLGPIRRRLSGLHAQLGQSAAEVALDIVERTRDELQAIPAKELPAAGRNMATIAGIAVDKHAGINGLPTEIVQRDSAEDIQKRLQAKHPQMFVDSTAEEIPDAEVVKELSAGGSSR